VEAHRRRSRRRGGTGASSRLLHAPRSSEGKAFTRGAIGASLRSKAAAKAALRSRALKDRIDGERTAPQAQRLELDAVQIGFQHGQQADED